MSSRTAESVLAELQPIFREALDEQRITVTPSSSSWNTPNWDSLAHIDLIEMVERHFKVKFSLVELQDLKDVADLIKKILEKSNTG